MESNSKGTGPMVNGWDSMLMNQKLSGSPEDRAERNESRRSEHGQDRDEGGGKVASLLAGKPVRSHEQGEG